MKTATVNFIKNGDLVEPYWGQLPQILLICLLMFTGTYPADAAQPALEVSGFFEMDGTTSLDPDPEHGEFYFGPNGNPDADYELPLDVTASPWELPVKPDSGMWVYANNEGRVRTYATTGAYGIDDSGTGFAYSQFGYAKIFWNGYYIRSDSSDPKSTVNLSLLELFADKPGPDFLFNRAGILTPPFAKMNIAITLCGYLHKGVGGGDFDCVKLYQHESHIAGTFDHVDFPIQVVTAKTSNLLGDVPLIKTTGSPVSLSLEHPVTEVKTGLADTWDIAIGEHYKIIFELEVEVGQDADENIAKALLGDPLDADLGGITLNTTHTRVPSNIHICKRALDPYRFEVHNDGTVTDANTGLMWQRCPLNYTLNENGTPADLGDDLCTVNTIVSFDWQSALQKASSDSLATYTDWQLPNVKQLESLVDLNCYAPTIDTQSFPATPAVPFWTSTPAARGDQAWQVSFASGDVSPDRKTETNRVRLVRNSGTIPVLPTPALVAGNASLVEGDAGSSLMNFRIELSSPSSSDVSVEYETQEFSASGIDDFVNATGTLTIPAGEQAGTISVTVNGDTFAEGNETFWLFLSEPSAGVYLARAASIGTIFDDEPTVSVAAAMPQLVEGNNTGTQTFEFVVSLDKPAVGAVNVDYTTVDNTATGGVDYDAVSGTLNFNPGEDSVSIMIVIHGDTQPENDEIFDLVISNVIGGASLDINPASSKAMAIIINDDAASTYQALNDSGVTYCANAAATGLSCPQSGFPQQDGESGRDATANDDSDGIAGFSFTKLDSNGVPLVNQAAIYQYTYFPAGPAYDIWDCVQDQVTGLAWEIKTDVIADLRNYDWTYTWYNSTGLNDGGNAGTENGGACVDSTNCDTEKYIAAINAASLCGFNDWRLPTVDELYTLAVSAAPSVSTSRGLDSNYFPHNYAVNGSLSQGYTYWSANTAANVALSSWALEFQAPDPQNIQIDKASPTPVRLVRGGS